MNSFHDRELVQLVVYSVFKIICSNIRTYDQLTLSTNNTTANATAKDSGTDERLITANFRIGRVETDIEAIKQSLQTTQNLVQSMNTPLPGHTVVVDDERLEELVAKRVESMTLQTSEEKIKEIVTKAIDDLKSQSPLPTSEQTSNGSQQPITSDTVAAIKVNNDTLTKQIEKSIGKNIGQSMENMQVDINAIWSQMANVKAFLRGKTLHLDQAAPNDISLPILS